MLNEFQTCALCKSGTRCCLNSFSAQSHAAMCQNLCCDESSQYCMHIFAAHCSVLAEQSQAAEIYIDLIPENL